LIVLDPPVFCWILASSEIPEYHKSGVFSTPHLFELFLNVSSKEETLEIYQIFQVSFSRFAPAGGGRAGSTLPGFAG
jgi:hypothetical protein